MAVKIITMSPHNLHSTSRARKHDLCSSFCRKTRSGESTMTNRAIALLALLPALALAGCSLPVSGTVEQVSDHLESHCGWYKDTWSPAPPADHCRLLVSSSPTEVVLPGTADPCDTSPDVRLAVPVGWPYSGWHARGDGDNGTAISIEPCPTESPAP